MAANRARKGVVLRGEKRKRRATILPEEKRKGGSEAAGKRSAGRRGRGGTQKRRPRGKKAKRAGEGRGVDRFQQAKKGETGTDAGGRASGRKVCYCQEPSQRMVDRKRSMSSSALKGLGRKVGGGEGVIIPTSRKGERFEAELFSVPKGTLQETYCDKVERACRWRQRPGCEVGKKQAFAATETPLHVEGGY